MQRVDVDVAVVGAGIAGSSAAYALARSGHDVVLFEQFHLGHARGSSHGTSRIFRLSYDDPTYVRMAMESLLLWRELEEESGEQLIVRLGGIDCGKDVQAHVLALKECDANYEMLSPEQVAARWPIKVPKGRDVLYQPDAGIALADRAVRAFVSSARAQGADVRAETGVRELAVDGSRAILSTDAETISAEVAVIAAGAWARNLVAGVGIDLPVIPTRETVAYFPMADELRVPAIVDWMESASEPRGRPAVYALPSPGVGIKAGEHHAGPVTNPDDTGEIDESSVERISRWVAARYPEADPRPGAAETCIYTNTDDERFVFERRGPVVVGSACSGHGFKFGPLTGRRLAELAAETRISAR